MTTENESRQRLERLARRRLEAMSGDDPMLCCWDMVARGIGENMLDVAGLQKTLGRLKQGQGYGIQEIFFEPWLAEVSPDVWQDQIQVRHLGEIAYCPAEEMREEMQRLLDAYHRPD